MAAIITDDVDVYAYCDTSAEDIDNARFLEDLEKHLATEIVRLKSPVFADTWDVWEKRQYIAGIAGAPCSGALKGHPRRLFQRDDDIHVFGYTVEEKARAKRFATSWGDLTLEFPLIEHSIDKAGCLALLEKAGLEPPRLYAMGFDHSNCIPCPKATSPAYWALVRQTHPAEFERMVVLSRKLNVRLARVKGERVFIDEIPADQKTSDPITPACDFMCQMVDV